MDDALLLLLPPEWLPYVRGALEGIALLALVLAPVKAALGDPMPTDGVWRKRLFALLHVLDWLAVNTEPVRRKMLRTGSIPPPEDKPKRKRNGLPFLVLALALSLAPACVSAPIQQATIAQAAASSINAVHDAIVRQIERERLEVLVSTHGPEAQAAALEVLLAKYQPLRDAYAGLATAFFVYVEAIRNAREHGTPVAPHLLTELRNAWLSVVAEARELGLTIPMPPVLGEALGGFQ